MARPWWIVLAFALGVPSGVAMAAPRPAAPPLAAAFLRSVGVNTHVYALNTAYGRLPAVIAALRYLGIRHVRDNPPRDARPDRYLALEQAGIGLDLVARSDAAPALSLYDALAPGLDVIEGPNEINAHRNSLLYSGLSGFPAALLLQTNLYDEAKADLKLHAVPVALFSVVYHVPADLPPYPGMAAKADLANVHAYPQAAAVPPDEYLPRDIARWAAAVPKAPVLVTEFGYFTLPDAPRGAGVTDDVQAKWLLDALADNFFESHVSRQYLYELVDQIADDAAPDKEHHFGLFDTDWQPKPAAKALHNLNDVLARSGAKGNGGFKSPVVNGLPTTGHSGVLTDAGGASYVLLWNEPDIWNPVTDQEIAATASPVSVSFPVASKISFYDPLGGALPVRQVHGNQITVNLTDHLLIVKSAG